MLYIEGLPHFASYAPNFVSLVYLAFTSETFI